MARAKTTERAEARRRHRAEAAASAAAETDAGGAGEGDVAPNTLNRDASRRSRAETGRGTRPTASPAGRVGIVDSFRLSARPADVQADLRLLPALARSRAVLVPGILIVATAAAYLVPGLHETPIVLVLVQSIVSPLGMIPAFLAGMLTPRASWLAGGVAGLVAGITTLVLVTIEGTGSAGSTFGSPLEAAGFVVLGVIFGIGVGGFAGFYRRFLAFSSANRTAAAARRKSAAKRR